MHLGLQRPPIFDTTHEGCNSLCPFPFGSTMLPFLFRGRFRPPWVYQVYGVGGRGLSIVYTKEVRSMDVFPFTPVGDVKISLSWNDKEVAFDNGSKQYVRKRIHARKSYAFSVCGAADFKTNLESLLKFYNDHRGLKDTFLFDYDGKMQTVRFSAAITPKCYRENGKIVTYQCDVTLDVLRQGEPKVAPTYDDILPVPQSKTEESYDWQTGKVELGAMTDYYTKRDTPLRKITGTWSGLKKERDKVLRIYDTYGKHPVAFENNGETLRVMLPDKLEVTDHREAGEVVGYQCQMELTVV